jgi:hypothetical protein
MILGHLWILGHQQPCGHSKQKPISFQQLAHRIPLESGVCQRPDPVVIRYGAIV